VPLLDAVDTVGPGALCALLSWHASWHFLVLPTTADAARPLHPGNLRRITLAILGTEESAKWRGSPGASPSS